MRLTTNGRRRGEPQREEQSVAHLRTEPVTASYVMGVLASDDEREVEKTSDKER